MKGVLFKSFQEVSIRYLKKRNVGKAMQRDYLLQDFKLKQDSIFDLTELYKLMFRWFENNGYAFHEKEYQDQDTPGGKQLTVFWVAEKMIDAYIKFVIEVNYLVLGMTKVEIERAGTKVSTNKGSIEFRISAYLLKDYDNKWSSTPFMKRVRKIYDYYLIKERIERLEGDLIIDYQALVDEIRSFLALHKF